MSSDSLLQPARLDQRHVLADRIHHEFVRHQHNIQDNFDRQHRHRPRGRAKHCPIENGDKRVAGPPRQSKAVRTGHHECIRNAEPPRFCHEPRKKAPGCAEDWHRNTFSGFQDIRHDHQHLDRKCNGDNNRIGRWRADGQTADPRISAAGHDIQSGLPGTKRQHLVDTHGAV